MTSELETKLHHRLEEAVQKKESQLVKIKQLQAELQHLFRKTPKRPRETIPELDKKIANLEHQRTVTSVSLAEERQILKQINGITKSKSQVQEYHAMEKRIQDTKDALDSLRDGQKVAIASIGEIEAALARVKLANKLGCRTQDLTTEQADCPQEKLGMVIGKHGNMIKQIMESAKVTIDVNKETNVISVTGSVASVAEAVAEIDKIVRAVDEEVEIPKALMSYLTAKHVNGANNLRQEYPTMHIEFMRSTGKLILRGAPEIANEVKQKVLGTDVVSRDRVLTGREFNTLLGKKGSTIDKLVATHKIFIEANKTDEDTARAELIGPLAQVEAAMTEIDELMSENREVCEKIPVSTIVKRLLLAESGRHIKALQSKVNEALDAEGASCYLTFGKDMIDSETPELSVKAKQLCISKAFELTKEGMKEIDALVVHLTVDPYIVPRIIGKGGETIKKLTAGKSGQVEVDRTSGRVTVGAISSDERDELLQEINNLIDENQVLRVKAEPNLIKAQFRELNRSKTRTEISEFAWLDCDERNNNIILRGKQENLEKAKLLVEEFLSNNFIEEIPATDEDLDALLSGGKDSKITKFASEGEVNLSADRSRHVVAIRGNSEKVKQSKRHLDQFLNGGDGHSVARLSVTEQVVGMIIGKGGKTRQQLQKKYDGVSIFISKAHRVSIRGPEDKVAACRVEILKMVASARITQTVSVSEEQKSTLEKNDAIKRIMQQAPAQITFSETEATVRGFFHDVRDAVSLLNEQLTGVYKTAIELEASQFAKTRATTRDSSHFERIQSSTDANVALDLSAGSIVVSGKRTHVRKAKDQVFGLLEFILPGEIHRMKLSKPLFSTVGKAAALADVSACVGGAAVYLDRDISSIVVRSPDHAKVSQAAEVVGQKIKDAEKLVYVFEVTPAEAWLVPLVIGKNGKRIEKMRKGTGCKFDVSKESRTVTIVGDSQEKVDAAKKEIADFVETSKKENVFISMPENAIPAFVGKGRAHIKELADEHGVEIQQLRKGQFQFRIVGKEDKVATAKNTIDGWISKWEQSRAHLEMKVDKQLISAVLGHKGETARGVESEYGCRVDVDRKSLTVTVRGGDAESRSRALGRIQEIVDKERTSKAETIQRRRAESSDSKPSDEPKPLQRTVSSDSNVGGEARVVQRNEFPSKPIGIVRSNSKQNGKKSKKVDGAVQLGTEQGRNLFQMLVSDQ